MRRKRYAFAAPASEIGRCIDALRQHLDAYAAGAALSPGAFRIRVPPPAKLQVLQYFAIETTWPERSAWFFVREVMRQEKLPGGLLFRDEKITEMTRREMKRLLSP